MKKTLPFSFHTSILFLLFLLIPIFSSVAAPADNSQEVARILRQHLDSLSSLSFNFTQSTKGQMSGRPRQASGKAFFVKNDKASKMRWNYSAPDLQVIISDGTILTMYFEKLNQMIIAPADSLQQDVTYSFFSGHGSIDKDFLIFPGQENSEPLELGFEVIKLVPKSPTSQVKNIRLWITDTTQIQRIEIRDNFDTITLLNLSHIEENNLVKNGQLINTDLFTFTPPEGTEIIRQ